MAHKRKKKKSPAVKILIVISVLVILAAAGICLALAVMQYYYGKTNYVSDDKVTLNYALLEQAKDEKNVDEDLKELESTDAEVVEVAVGEAGTVEIADSEDVYNLLLIGLDTGDGKGYGNADTMILLSVNQKNRTVYMTSFMRDLSAVIPYVGVRKLSAAYALGGGPLLVSTIESNYRIDIDHYAAIDFDDTAEIIDYFGGIDIELTEAEAAALSSVDLPVSAGYVHLNGVQAVAYSRIRSEVTAEGEMSDGRTARQGKVLNILYEKAQGFGSKDVLELLNRVLPLLTHNMKQIELAGLLAEVPEYLNYSLVTQRIPYDDLYDYAGEELVADYEETAKRLRSTIYGE